MKKRILCISIFLVAIMGSCSKETDNNSQPAPVVMYADIDNAKIAYKIYGEGEPLIMCIGYATNMDLWSTDVINVFQENYKVIVFDYRGMGYSTNLDSSFTISSLGEDVNTLLDKLNIKKANVLGWSMGGYVAQMFAVNHPEKVDKLVLYATDYGDTLTVNPSQAIIDILSNPSATPLERLGTLFPDDWLALNPEPWKVLPNATEPYDDETIGLQYEAVQEWLSPGGGSANELHKLNMPVLLICGDKDKVVPCVNSLMLNDSISSSTLIKMNDCGHGLMYQLPDGFADYVKGFLNN